LTILHAERGTFGPRMARGLAEAAEREGFRQVSILPCDLATVDPSGIPAGSPGGAPRAVVFGGNFQDEVRVIRSRAFIPWDVRRMGAVAAGMTKFGEAMGELSEGIVGPSQWEPGRGANPDVGPDEAWVLSSFRRAYGLEPEYPAIQAFAMGVVAAECARRAGSLRDEALREAAARLDVSTCFGRFRIIGENGRQVGHRPVLVEWCGGKKKVVWPPLEVRVPGCTG
jgi:branched-chain amino acid transport system substrate-binding protein